MISEKEKRGLYRLAKVADNGAAAIVNELNELEDKVDTEVRVLDSRIGTIEEQAVVLLDKVEEVSKQEGPQGKQGEPGKDGESIIGPKGDNGDSIVGPPGKDGKDGRTPDTTTIAVEASRMAEDRLKPFIPTIETLEKELPKMGQSIRDALELLPEDEWLDGKYIHGWKELLESLKKKGGEVMVGGIRFLSQLVDVRITDVQNNEVLKWDSTNKYWKNASDTAGTGDVVGPAGAVGDNVVFFDNTTGKLIKDSGLTLSGTNTGDQASGQTYSITNVSTDRAYDANSTTTDELADTLGTLIADLRSAGIIL